MELNFSTINIQKPRKSIGGFLKSKNNKYGKNQYLIDLIDYGMSLLRQEDIDLKIDILTSLIEENKNLNQLMDEFGKSSNLLRAIYELVSFGFINQKTFSDKLVSSYPDNEYEFNLDKLMYKIHKNLIKKKSILINEKKLFENEVLFQCKSCNKTYNYVEAIAINFVCCNNLINELKKEPIIAEIDKKIDLINKKLDELTKI
ncbi:MAG: hypothetical protein ACTSYZ_09050 [Candidatus Helarchaeota archaeon]